jgi:hypothetical protein
MFYSTVQYTVQYSTIHRLRLEICPSKSSLAPGRGAAGPLHPLFRGSLLGRPHSALSQTMTQSTPQASHRHVNKRTMCVQYWVYSATDSGNVRMGALL